MPQVAALAVASLLESAVEELLEELEELLSELLPELSFSLVSDSLVSDGGDLGRP